MRVRQRPMSVVEARRFRSDVGKCGGGPSRPDKSTSSFGVFSSRFLASTMPLSKSRSASTSNGSDTNPVTRSASPRDRRSGPLSDICSMPAWGCRSRSKRPAAFRFRLPRSPSTESSENWPSLSRLRRKSNAPSLNPGSSRRSRTVAISGPLKLKSRSAPRPVSGSSTEPELRSSISPTSSCSS